MKNTNIYVFIVIAPCRNIGKLRRLPEAKEKQKFYNFPFTCVFFCQLVMENIDFQRL